MKAVEKKSGVKGVLFGICVLAIILLVVPWVLAADVLIDNFNGPFPGGIDEHWERYWWNGTWLPTNADYTSPPDAQAFAIYLGDTCNTGCESAIVYGQGGDDARIALRDFAADIDATKPWSLTCNVNGHNDGERPDYFLGYWCCEFMIRYFDGGMSKEYRNVHWNSENDRIWDQITFSTAGSTSGDDEVHLTMWVRWGPYAIPMVQDSYVVFDDVRLTYTPDNGDVTPPGQVAGLTATRGDGEIELTWQNPPDADFAGTLIRVRTDHLPVSTRDGDLVVDLPGSPGVQQSFVHQPADNERSYYYAAYTYDNRTTGPNPDADYANYSEAATAEALVPPTPTVDADISLVESLGWDVVNHGNAASPNFDDSVPPTAWDTTTPTPSEDNLSAEIDTVGLTTNCKWREDSDLSSTSATTMFIVWKPRQGMSCSPAGVWGSSAHNVFEFYTAGVKLKVNADSELSMFEIPVPEGLTEIGLHDSVDPPEGLGTQFATFPIETDKWQRWWLQVDVNRYFKLYDLNNVLPGEGPHLLASGQLGYDSGETRITIGDSSSTASIDSDFLVDEVYVLDSFRDASEVTFLPPAHDECADAVEVRLGVPYVGSSVGASGTDITSCTYNDTRDVWHCFTAPISGRYTFSLNGSIYDTALALFIPCGGTEKACNDNYYPGNISRVIVDLIGGFTYYIRVSGYNGDTGYYTLTVTLAADISKDNMVNLADYALLADSWLQYAASDTDIAPTDDGDCVTNMLDVDIFIDNWLLCLPPDQASNPNPPDGATGISRTADLSWTAGAGATSHDVYFGTSNPPPFIQNQLTTKFDPGTMAYNTRYYWRIDEVNPSGKTTGVVWSFSTIMSPPPQP
jgi:hypothetical protein